MHLHVCVRVVENLSRVQNKHLDLCNICVSPTFPYQGEKWVIVRHYLFSSRIHFSLHVVSPTFMFLKQQHHDYSFPSADLCFGECLTLKLLKGKTRTLSQETLASPKFIKTETETCITLQVSC